MTEQVILVDDDPVQRRLLEAHVSRMGYRPIACETGRMALDMLRIASVGHRPAAMVLDLSMPGMDGMEVLAELRRSGLELPVVVQTAKGSVETAVEAMRAGAFDFVVKPASPERLRAVIERAVRTWNGGRRRGTDTKDALSENAGVGAAMLAVLHQARRAATSSIPILIQGETGVGKERLAAAIHASGGRAARRMVALNCAALPGALAESILFGHAKGAFTDASESRPGKFVEADGGTLFLDEIGELPLDVQAKLLRAIETGTVDAVGEAVPARVDVRILSATNRDLEAEVAAGRFRADLFFRLNVLTIEVPPLRRRRDEIAPLARRFLAEIAGLERPGREMRLAPLLLARLEAFDWPGNIRQLENAIHRAVVLAEGDEIDITDFPQFAKDVPMADGPFRDGHDRITSPPSEAPGGERPEPSLRLLDAEGEIRTMEAMEGDLIRHALLRYGGRPSEVAKRLGIGRSTLYRKMRIHRIAG